MTLTRNTILDTRVAVCWCRDGGVLGSCMGLGLSRSVAQDWLPELLHGAKFVKEQNWVQPQHLADEDGGDPRARDGVERRQHRDAHDDGVGHHRDLKKGDHPVQPVTALRVPHPREQRN